MTRHIYDGSLRLITVLDAQSASTAFEYNSQDLRIAVTDPLGKRSAFAYDARGNVVSATDPLGNQVQLVYDSSDNLTRVTTPKGTQIALAYDIRGNLLEVLDALGQASAFGYDGSGQLIESTDARGGKTSFTYDAHGNLTRLADAVGSTVEFAYDAVGRMTQLKDGNGNPLAATYDAEGRVLTVTDPLGNTVSLSYDLDGNLTSRTDANGNVTRYTYDATSNLTQVADALGGNTRYGYDELNNRTTVTDANNHVTALAYDAVNRLVSNTDALGYTTQYEYDAAGRVASKIDARNKQTAYSYDDTGRLRGIAYADGKMVAYTYDANGNRTSMTDSRGMSAYQYDLLDRLVEIQQADGKIVGYEYDSVGNRIRTIYPDGTSVSNTYDAANRLKEVLEPNNQTTTYDYDPAHNLTSISYPNGTQAAITYDLANRLARILHTGPAGPIADISYTMDRAGNRLAMTELGNKTTRYTYDVLSRLTGVTFSNGLGQIYAYDAVGNRTRLTAGAVVTNYTYDAADRMLTAGTQLYTYDENGNVATRRQGTVTTNFTFDAANRLVSVVRGTSTTSMEYDGDGNRVGLNTPSGNYSFIVDPLVKYPVVLSESGPDGPIKYTYGLGLLSATSPSFRHIYHQDGLGSTRAITDANGALMARYDYTPWGQLQGAVDPLGNKAKFKFTGEQYDSSTGLYFLRARYFDASAGRFLSQDPVFGSLDTYRYAYAANAPTVLVDKSGQWSQAAHEVLIRQSLEGVAPGDQIEFLVQEDARFDWDMRHQAFMHSMRTEGMSVQRVISARDRFIISNIELATQASGERALTFLDHAMHTVMDMFSPWHVSNGVPIVWTGSRPQILTHIMCEGVEQLTNDIRMQVGLMLVVMYQSVFPKTMGVISAPSARGK